MRAFGELSLATLLVAALLTSVLAGWSSHFVASALAAVLVAAAGFVLWPAPVRWRRGRLSIYDATVRLDDVDRGAALELGAVGWTWAFQHRGRHHAALESGGDTLVVRMSGARAAERLLDGLGAEPARRRVGGALERPPHASVTLGLVILVAFVVLSLDLFASELTAIAAVLIAIVIGRVLDDAVFGGQRVEVGQDGVALIAFARRRIVLFDEIGRAHADDGVVELALLNGTTARLHCAPQATRQTRLGRGSKGALLRAAAQGQALALAQWINAGIDRARRLRCDDAAAYRPFARRARSLEAWRRALVGAEPYRRGEEISADSARRVFEDPCAPAGARLGAALALIDRDPAARTRVLDTADALVQLDLADVLRRAARGELAPDAETERQLRAFDWER